MMPQQSTADLYQLYTEHLQKTADIRYALALLQWDQETYLPAKGNDFRSRQMATLSETAHELFTAEAFGHTLQHLLERNDLSAQQRKNVALSWYDYSKQIKLSPAFVRQMSEAVSTSFHTWMQARKQNDFASFELPLIALVTLKLQEADMLGYESHPYNAMLNEYERGATVQLLDKVFGDVVQPLKSLLDKVLARPSADDEFLRQHFPKQQQWDWGMYLAKQLGFDFEAGRQDISEHPFTTNFNSKDVRLTTRIDEHDFSNMTWSTIHEVGHGLYEQGLPDAQYGLPLGEYASLSVHESQSRFWENCICRGKAFWQFYYPELQKQFPQQLKNIDVDAFLAAINKVQASLIRTEADELTYHFHVIIRYELEKQLLSKDLQVKDIPAFWNESYQKWLGVTVPDAKNGCLQDVHWSHGSFGYFPTYSLGSFYAAQFWQHIKAEMPDVEQTIASTGDVSALLQWMRTNIHQHGRFYNSEELCSLATGKNLDSSIFVQYLANKFNV
jgi:carboxypeptidase Taq